MKARIDGCAVRVRAMHGRWMPLGQVLIYLVDWFESQAPPVDPAALSYWAKRKYHKCEHPGRPLKPEAKVKISRAVRRAERVPRSPGLTD